MSIGSGALELGLGTIGLGRPWPAPDAVVPRADAVAAFLDHAISSGVRFVDTAPAYGASEARVGAFVTSLTPTLRAEIVVATKVGETWDTGTGSIVDHSLDACRRSLD